jgi:TM2 domain-containing membrane protein YozV
MATSTQVKRCPQCGTVVVASAVACPTCGLSYVQSQAPPQYAPPPNYAPAPPYVPPGTVWKAPGTHSVLLAVLLSLCCIVGAGQLVNGQVAKGLVLFCAALVIGVLTGGVGTLVFWALAVVDAGLVAQKLNRGWPVGQWDWF